MTYLPNIPFNRRQMIAGSLVAGAAACIGASDPTNEPESKGPPAGLSFGQSAIPVAFLLDQGATMIDFSGPWEVFQDTSGRFDLSIVAPTAEPITMSGGMRIIPHYSLSDAPTPKVIVIPAQSGGRQDAPTTQAKIDWLRARAADADVVMSVCTGAFLLARTGLLDGLNATTHHDFIADFERQFPRVHVQRHRRFVDNGKIVTSGGLTSGVDAALHIVSRYHGADYARDVANYMEYESRSWLEGSSV